MNPITNIIGGMLLFRIASLTYRQIGEVFAKDIYIVNNLDFQLEFKEIKNREHIEITSGPPEKIEAGKTDSSLNIKKKNIVGSKHLNINYYLNNPDSGEQVGILYKSEEIATGDGSYPKDHTDEISEVQHCGSWNNNKKWKYTFSPK